MKKNLTSMMKTALDCGKNYNVEEEVILQLTKVTADVISNVISSNGAVIVTSNVSGDKIETITKEVPVIKEVIKEIVVENVIEKEVVVQVENTDKITQLEALIVELTKERDELKAKLEEVSVNSNIEIKEVSTQESNIITSFNKRYKKPTDKHEVAYGSVNINNKELFFEAGQMNVPLVYGATDKETLLVRDELNKLYPGVLGTSDGDLNKVYAVINNMNCYMTVAENGKVLGYIGEYCFFWSPEKSEHPFVKKANLGLVKSGLTNDAASISTALIESLGLYDIADALLEVYNKASQPQQAASMDDILAATSNNENLNTEGDDEEEDIDLFNELKYSI